MKTLFKVCDQVFMEPLKWISQYIYQVVYHCIPIYTNTDFAESIRNSHQRYFVRKGALRNFAKFTGKHFCQSLFFNKVAVFCNFIKKETLAQVFSCEFCEISKDTSFTELLWATASRVCNNISMKNVIKRR